MYAIRYALAAVLWCAVVGDGLATDVISSPLIINLPYQSNFEYEYHLHQDENNVLMPIAGSAQASPISNLVWPTPSPDSWSGAGILYYQAHFKPSAASVTPPITLNLPTWNGASPFNNTIQSSSNTYTVYETNVDGVGVAFRVTAFISTSDFSLTYKVLNSGQSGLLFPSRGSYTGIDSRQVHVVAQAALVKVRRKQFRTNYSNPVFVDAHVGDFEIQANTLWFGYHPRRDVIRIPLYVRARINLNPQTCTFTPATTTVALPLVPAANFNPTEQDNLLPSVPFEFGVDCGSNSAIKVRAAIQDVTNDQNTSSILKNAGSAQNVGVQILYKNNPVTLSKLEAAYHMPDPYNGSKLEADAENKFKLTARYKKIDPNADVSAGSVRAQAKIYFYYQ